MSSGFGDWFVFRTCTFPEGGVMILWLGPLGRYVGASDHATALFCIGCGCVLVFCTLIPLHFVVVRHTLMIKHSLYMWL